MLKDMRSYLQLIDEKDDLVHITRPVSPKFEIAAGNRKTSDIKGPALWFDNVVDSSMPVVAGLFGVRRRALWGLEVFDDNISSLSARYMHGLRHPIPPRIVKDGPCKEVILTGDDADFGMLPVCSHHEKDGGVFITMGIQIARHPVYGNNASISRMHIFDGKTAGVLTTVPQQLAVYHLDAEARGEPLEVAVTIGNDPYSILASQIQGNIYLDELTVAGGWMGEPLDLVPCETIDVAVPATSEIVLEGELLCGERRVEGPFAEYPGYYGPAGMRPVFKLKAITHRRNPIYLAGLTGMPNTDNHVLKQVATESIVYDRIRQICPTVKDVCLTDGGAGAHLVVSMKPTFATQARDVMLAAFTTERFRLKRVIVVDEDVDVRDPEAVEWAMAFRFQADKDVVIIDRMQGHSLDPSAPGHRVGAIMGIDATVPYGEDYGDITIVPGADEFEIPGWTDRKA